uniref:Uncharacterized protein n=1 Tax=Corvus moneduloides TaxID=1196302 RepID=A0A8C3E4P7_CORMO
MAVHYCGLCRRSAFTGRRHLYSAGHRRRLRETLARLQEATAAARAAVADVAAAVQRYDPAEHDGRVWCPCCGRGVRRDRRCGGRALLQAGLLRHLAGPEHRRQTARFWRENRAEAALRERCLVPAEEYERFAQALEQALSEQQRREEERILQMAADIRETERRQRETVQAALQVGELYPALAGPWRGPGTALQQPGPSRMQTGPDLAWMESSQVLTFIGHQVGATGVPIHSAGHCSNMILKFPSNPNHSTTVFFSEEKQKLKKLPVERVGANFDHTSQTSDSWLPSFGRVWNHGRRWQSRHQFRTESGEKKKKR